MGHWEQIAVESRKERERRATWPRWRRELYRRAPEALAAAFWIILVAIGLRALGLL